MPRLTRIYTRTGDDGSTALGGGQRLSKSSERIEAYGSVDELNSVLGVALASGLHENIGKPLASIQNDLLHLGSDLCILEEDKKKLKVPGIEERHIKGLEKTLDRLAEELGPLENFILPGGSVGAAHLHVARCVCRRAERRVVTLKAAEEIGAFALQYLNRLSDLLFVMARYENLKREVPDVTWDSYA